MRHNLTRTMKKILLLLFLWPAFMHAQISSKIQGNKSELTGKWTNNQFGFAMILELNGNGNGTFDGEKISYTVSPGVLSVVQDGEVTKYKYVLQGGKLTLSGGDLDAPIAFTRGEQTAVSQKAPPSSSGNVPSGKPQALIGTWSGNGETMVFQSGGKGSYNNIPFSYSVSGSVLTIAGSSGTSELRFNVNGNYLTLSGNGTTVMLQKGTAYSGAGGNNSAYESNPGASGGIDQSIVGKWCWVNASSTYTSSYSGSKCIVINGNGTYEYYAEGSVSGYGGGYYGGSSSQNSDSGTWRLAGNVIHVNSRSEGNKTYSFEKRNHPKNGDPMIVIDGDTYVTHFKRAPWR